MDGGQPPSLAPGPLTIGGLVRRVGGSLLLNAACPWIAYQLLTAGGWSARTALRRARCPSSARADDDGLLRGRDH